MTNYKKKTTIALFATPELEARFENELWKIYYTETKKLDLNLVLYAGHTLNSPRGFESQENVIYSLVNPELIDGIILVSSILGNNTRPEVLNNFINEYRHIPMVSIGIELEMIPSILVNDKEGMQLVIDHLIEIHNRRNIVFICGPENHAQGQLRYKAYCESLAAHDIKYKKELVLSGDFSLLSGVSAMRQFLQGKRPRFDAVVAANDNMIQGAIDVLREHDYTIPDDVAVAGFDHSEELEFHTIPLTSINQPKEAIVKKSLELILGILRGENVSMIHELSTKLVVSESCGCYPFIQPVPKVVAAKKQNSDIMAELKNNKPAFIKECMTLLEIPQHIVPFLYELSDAILNIIITDQNDYDTIQRRVYRLLNSTTIMKNKFNYLIPLISIMNNTVLQSLTDQDLSNNIRNIFNSVIHLIAVFMNRQEGRAKFEISIEDSSLQHFQTAVNNCQYFDEFLEVLDTGLSRHKIRTYYLCLYSESPYKLNEYQWNIPRHTNLVCLNKKNNTVMYEKFKTKHLVSDLVLHSQRDRYTWYIKPLYKAKHHYGYIILDLETDNEFYIRSIAEIISMGVHSIRLLERQKRSEKKLTRAIVEVEKKSTQFLESNMELEKLHKMKNDYMINITHDLRSSLMVIMNTVDLGLKYQKDKQKKTTKNYQTINKATVRLESTIDKLLDLLNMDNQGLDLKINKVNIRKLLHDLSSFYKKTILFSGITIIDLFDNSEVEEFYSDQEKLETILYNVLSNAVTFVDPEKGKIYIDIQDKQEFLHIIIKDNGIGIEQEQIDQILNHFEQGTSARNSLYKGTGLGLAFAKQLTELLKGTIHVQSDGPGKGSTLTLAFPKGKAVFDSTLFVEEINEPAEQSKSAQNNISLVVQSDLSQRIESGNQEKGADVYITELNNENEYDRHKGIILIIDDDENIRNIVMEYLKNANYKNFILAHDGKVGIDVVYEYKPDLILCDYKMPNMRGDQFHDELISNPDFRRIPFIFITGVLDKDIILERKRKGMILHLKKPIEENDLITTVEVNMRNYLDYKEILQQSITDELTGVNNKRHFMNLLFKQIALRRLDHLSILFIDIDHFKNINDTYGHPVGDQVLREVGKIIKNTIRDYDVSGRYGGEEFIIFLPDTDIQKAEVVATKLSEKIRDARITTNSDKLSITASFGISSLINNEKQLCDELNINSLQELFTVMDNTHVDWDTIKAMKNKLIHQLIEFADRALYKAKSTICNNCGFQSTDDSLFGSNKCPDCGENNIVHGRNKCILYQ